jgi:hypothetical protein
MESEALQLALEVLEELLEQTGTPPHKNCSCHIAPPCPDCVDYSGVRYAIEQTNKAITAIKAALAQPAQEPVACVMGTYGGRFVVAPLNSAVVLPVGMAFYTTPPKRPWVGLTQKEVQEIHDTYHKRMGPQEFASMLEAKLKEKNNG